jgi:hypothetical protein
MVLWAVPWTVLGLAMGIVARLGVFGEVVVAEPFERIPLVVAAALVGTVTGLVNGLIFALLLLIAERGRGIAALRPWRFGIWGAIASGLPGAAFTQNLYVTAIFAVIGALAGVLALALAKAGSPREAPVVD